MQLVILVVLAVVVGGLSAAAILRHPAAPTGAPIKLNPSPSSTVKPPIDFTTTLPQAMARLKDHSRPFNVMVLGDSTGVNPDGWQKMTMDWLSKTTNRPWEMESWNQTHQYGGPGYLGPWNYLGGSWAPLVLWNASAGGRDFIYDKHHYRQMVPKRLKSLDLLIVNHGHNLNPVDEYYSAGVPLIKRLHERFPGMAVMVVAQNPEKSNSLGHHLQEAVAEARYFAQTEHLPLVDVYKAFYDTGHYKQLIDSTLFHPTIPGYRIWFHLVQRMLTKAMS